MKPYAELTRLGQLRRIRQLAQVALGAYGLSGARLIFLRYFANITYRVELPGPFSAGHEAGPYLPNRLLLRVLSSGNWDYALGEMTWLAALSRDAGLPVPQPVPTREGELLARVTTPGAPRGRIVSLMRWVDGRRPPAELRPHHLCAWGRMVARLHQFAAGWNPPEGFRRYVWDWEGLLGGRGFGRTVGELVDTMPARLQEPFLTVSGQARALMAALGTGPNAYGMVHGDMYPENLLLKGGEVLPIDFEDCGFGYWLWDIAVALSERPWTDAWYRRRDAFLTGYGEVHTLPGAQLEHLDLFMAAQYATCVLWASQFILDDPARRTQHEAWRDENGELLLRHFERRRR